MPRQSEGDSIVSIFNPETAEDKMAQAFGCIVLGVIGAVVAVVVALVVIL